MRRAAVQNHAIDQALGFGLSPKQDRSENRTSLGLQADPDEQVI